MVHELCSTLDSGIANLAYFLWIKFLPTLVVELLIELADEFGVDEVNKGVTHIA